MRYPLFHYLVDSIEGTSHIDGGKGTGEKERERNCHHRNRENCIKQTQFEFCLDIGFWEENEMNRGLWGTWFCMSSYAFMDNDVIFLIFSSFCFLKGEK